MSAPGYCPSCARRLPCECVPPPTRRRWTFQHEPHDAFPYVVRDTDGTRRAMFWIRGDAARYVRDRNRALDIEPPDIGESAPCC